MRGNVKKKLIWGNEKRGNVKRENLKRENGEQGNARK
jgi:hypothetical protein